jgi:hypothetical protein
MNDIVAAILFIVISIISFSLAAVLSHELETKQKCQIAEISPDITPEMREKCRQLRQTNRLTK